MLSPPGIELRVRGLHAQNRPAEEAVAGQRVALNVTGPRLSKDAVTRGDWVLHPDVHAPTARFDVRLTLLAEEARALRADAPVHLHLGAAHVTARVARAGRRPDRTRQHGAGAADARSADRCAGARSAGAARRDGDAHHRWRRGDRSVSAAARPAHAGTARATGGAGSAGSGRRIARAVGAAARLDRPRRIPPRAQPAARGAAVGAVGRAGGRGRRPADGAGDARCAARRRGASVSPRITRRRRISRGCSSSGCAWRRRAGHRWRRFAPSSNRCSGAARWSRTVPGFVCPRIAPRCRRRTNACGSRRAS